MNMFLYMYLFTALACNHEIQHLIYFIFLNWLFVVKKKKKKKRLWVGSGQMISGTGRVRASV